MLKTAATTKIIIVRHGNTFQANETPRRIGARTDLPLVESGIEQAKKVGLYLATRQLVVDFMFCGTLKRTYQTAQILCNAANLNIPILQLEQFNEIDHGPDENKTEEQVTQRIGPTSLERWNRYGDVPNGWLAKKADLAAIWAEFAQQCVVERPHKTSLVVTSNGLAKFALNLVSPLEKLPNDFDTKLGTGCLSIFEFTSSGWQVHWGLRP